MLGENIYRLRKSRGMTQKQLAKDLSVVPQAISRWERNRAQPNVELLPKIADLFEVSLDELFDRKTGFSNEKDNDAIRSIVRQEIKSFLCEMGEHIELK